MTRLTPHFQLSEFTSSQTALRRGLDNTPPPEVIGNLKNLCEYVLEPVRKHFGAPVIISSGYRSPAVNRAVRGSASSQHCMGQAADFEIPGISNVDIAEWIRDWLTFDQLILEFYTPGVPDSGWVHVSWRMPLRRQALTAARLARGKTQYFAGIVA